MNVLIACEESQRVCIAFRRKGHIAFSADIQTPSGDHPEWHIHGDVLKILDGGYFETMDETRHKVDKWDLIIAHPPCTYLAVSGNRWLNIEKYGDKAIKRYSEREKAAKFFMRFINAKCEKIAVENPIGYMSTYYQKPTQIIQPYEYGHTEQKKTCLWLKGLPKLQETNNVYEEMMKLPVKERCKIWYMGSNHSKERSKTYEGIASAMAEQWG